MKHEKAPEAEGVVEGGTDGTVGRYQDWLALALKEFAKEYRLPVKVSFNKTRGEVDYEQRLATGLMWTDLVVVIFFCLGFLWNGDGFAWEWQERKGKRHQRLLRLSGKALADHIEFFFPVIRALLLYALTGTRRGRIMLLGWVRDDYRGWIDFDRRMIIRNGRLAPEPDSKPRRPSRVLRPVLGLIRRWSKEDAAQRAAEEWDDPDAGGYYVVHDGRGDMVENLGYRRKEAFEAVGLAHRLHDAKSFAVGIIWAIGYSLDRVARFTGNNPRVIHEHYHFLEADSEGTSRPTPNEKTLTLLKLLDPEKTCRRVPRASKPGPPPPDKMPKKRRRRG
jgi:hypothetical protein